MKPALLTENSLQSRINLSEGVRIQNRARENICIELGMSGDGEFACKMNWSEKEWSKI
jgi:hypothetical protein